RDALDGALKFILKERRVPERVFVGPDPVPPADFLVAMAEAWNSYRTHGELPTRLGISLGHNLRIQPERHVAEDRPGLFGVWIIHKADFRAAKVMEIA